MVLPSLDLGSGSGSASGSGARGPGAIMIVDIPDQTVTIGMNANLSCDASSVDGPIVSYLWARDGEELADGPTTSGSVISGNISDLLNIEGVTDEDEGGYTCTVCDSTGSVATSNIANLTAGKSPQLALSIPEAICNDPFPFLQSSHQ